MKAGTQTAWIKRYLPASLFGRSLLILVLPMVIMQAAALFFFYERHWDNMQRNFSRWLAGEVAFLVYEMERADDKREVTLGKLARNFMDIEIQRISDKAEIPKTFTSSSDDKLLLYFASQLDAIIREPFHVQRTPESESVILYVKLDEGVLRMRLSIKRLASVTAEIFIWWMVGSAVLLLMIATLFLRNQIRPIHRLAEAAEQFGRGKEDENFRPSGATEVRKAGRSFIAMRERLKRMISARTDMLAAISHDLRTPLTRMHLALAMFPNSKHTTPLLADVKEMEKMIQEYLDFARGEGGEKQKQVRLSTYLTSHVNSYAQQGLDIAVTSVPDIDMVLFPNAMRRCLSNVIENALRYGTRAEVQAVQAGRNMEILIDDDGPGIPVDKRETAMQPFRRLDAARDPNTGGAGLGLSIVQDIALRHGGKVMLEDSPLGGLRVRIRIPT